MDVVYSDDSRSASRDDEILKVKTLCVENNDTSRRASEGDSAEEARVLTTKAVGGQLMRTDSDFQEKPISKKKGVSKKSVGSGGEDSQEEPEPSLDLFEGAHVLVGLGKQSLLEAEESDLNDNNVEEPQATGGTATATAPVPPAVVAENAMQTFVLQMFTQMAALTEQVKLLQEAQKSAATSAQVDQDSSENYSDSSEELREVEASRVYQAGERGTEGTLCSVCGERHGGAKCRYRRMKTVVIDCNKFGVMLRVPVCGSVDPSSRMETQPSLLANEKLEFDGAGQAAGKLIRVLRELVKLMERLDWSPKMALRALEYNLSGAAEVCSRDAHGLLPKITRLLRVFCSRDRMDDEKMRIREMKQRPGQTLHDFATKVKEVVEIFFHEDEERRTTFHRVLERGVHTSVKTKFPALVITVALAKQGRRDIEETLEAMRESDGAFQVADKSTKEENESDKPVAKPKGDRKDQKGRGKDGGKEGTRKNKCYRCGGTDHKIADCKEKESLCFKCKKPGHRAQDCKGKKEVLATGAQTLPRVALPLGNGEVLAVVVDTGSVEKLLPLKLAKALEGESITTIQALKEKPDSLTGVTGHELELVGTAWVHVVLGEHTIPVMFYVTSNSSLTLVPLNVFAPFGVTSIVEGAGGPEVTLAGVKFTAVPPTLGEVGVLHPVFPNSGLEVEVEPLKFNSSYIYDVEGDGWPQDPQHVLALCAGRNRPCDEYARRLPEHPGTFLLVVGPPEVDAEVWGFYQKLKDGEMSWDSWADMEDLQRLEYELERWSGHLLKEFRCSPTLSPERGAALGQMLTVVDLVRMALGAKHTGEALPDVHLSDLNHGQREQQAEPIAAVVGCEDTTEDEVEDEDSDESDLPPRRDVRKHVAALVDGNQEAADALATEGEQEELHTEDETDLKEEELEYEVAEDVPKWVRRELDAQVTRLRVVVETVQAGGWRRDRGRFNFHIDTQGRAVVQRPRRLNPRTREALQEFVDEMVASERISRVEDTSQEGLCIVNMLFVKKPNGTLRPCIDMRPVNQLVVKDKMPVTSVREVLDQTDGSAKCFMVVDIKWGFWMLPIQPGDRKRACFYGPRGEVYSWNVMPFGFSNAPTAFQRFMQHVLLGLEGVLAYVDDILIEAENYEQLMGRFSALVERLEREGVAVSIAKLQIGASVRLLGWIRDAEGIKPDPKKMEALRLTRSPRNVRELRGVLGALRFLAPALPRLAHDTARLNKLTGKGPFKWGDEEEAILRHAIESLVDAIVQKSPDWERPFFIKCDASNLGVGGYLFQLDEQQREQVVSCFSETLGGTRRGWKVLDKEAYAIVKSVDTFASYVVGAEFRIFTDHRPLTYIVGNQSVHKSATGKVSRWAMTLKSFDFDLVHIAGSKNVFADALSRPPILPDVEEEEGVVGAVVVGASQGGMEEEEVAVESHKNSLAPDKGKEEASETDEDDELHCNGGAHLTKVQLAAALAGQGVSKTQARRRAKEAELRCDLCQRVAGQMRKTPLEPSPTPHRPLEVWGLDLKMLPEDENGYRYVLVAVDAFTGWVELVPLLDKAQDGVAWGVLDSIFRRYGPPRRINCDGGGEFDNSWMKRICAEQGVELHFSVPHRPQGNGLAERMVQEVHRLFLRLEPNARATWSEWLGDIQHRLNTTVSRTHGYTPFFLVYGFHSAWVKGGEGDKEPDAEAVAQDAALEDIHRRQVLLEEARTKVDKTRQAMKQHHDGKRRVVERDPPLVGTEVLIRNLNKGSKFEDMWIGPALVKAVKGKEIQVEFNGRTKKISADDWKPPAVANKVVTPGPPEEEPQGETPTQQRVSLPKEDQVAEAILKLMSTDLTKVLTTRGRRRGDESGVVGVQTPFPEAIAQFKDYRVVGGHHQVLTGWKDSRWPAKWETLELNVPVYPYHSLLQDFFKSKVTGLDSEGHVDDYAAARESEPVANN
jgi:transposase InsO family protein